MTDLSYLSEEVLKAVYDTIEYKDYRALLEKVKEDPVLYARVNEFREKNFLLQQSDSEDLLDMMDALTNEYEDVINIELVNEFLEAEIAFMRMMQDFNHKLIDGLEFD